MIHKLTTLWPCATGNEWDLPKVHAQFHVTYNIACMGNQMNVHSGPHRRPTTLKYKSVRPNMHKARRSEAIDFQIAKPLAGPLVLRSIV
jgi:hypothetical protein